MFDKVEYMLEETCQLPVSLMLIRETTESLFESLKAECGGRTADKSLVHSSAGCMGPAPVTKQWRGGCIATVAGTLSALLEEAREGGYPPPNFQHRRN